MARYRLRSLHPPARRSEPPAGRRAAPSVGRLRRRLGACGFARMTERRYAWGLVGVLWLVALPNYVDRQVIFSLFPLLAGDMALSAVKLGLLSTVFLWVYGLLSPFAGFAADRFGRGRLITISLLVWSAVTLATGVSRTYGQLVAARAVMGLSEACYLPAALARIARHHGSRTRSLPVGIPPTQLYAALILAR